jgi:hypothetical protein
MGILEMDRPEHTVIGENPQTVGLPEQAHWYNINGQL